MILNLFLSTNKKFEFSSGCSPEVNYPPGSPGGSGLETQCSASKRNMHVVRAIQYNMTRAYMTKDNRNQHANINIQTQMRTRTFAMKRDNMRMRMYVRELCVVQAKQAEAVAVVSWCASKLQEWSVLRSVAKN